MIIIYLTGFWRCLKLSASHLYAFIKAHLIVLWILLGIRLVMTNNASVSNKEIVKHLKVCRKNVYSAWKQFRESGTTFSEPIPGRTCTVSTKTIVSVKKKMGRNQQGSVGKVVKDAGISRSMQRVRVEDLKLTKYKKQSRQLVSEPSKQKCLNRGKLMLKEIERGSSKIFIWSDRKMFTVGAMTNKQHEGVYARKSGDLSVNVISLFRRQKAICVMV